MSDVLEVFRGDFSIEDPWAIPPHCQVVRLVRSTDGSPPRLPTTVSAYYDERYLNVVFSASDDHVVATMMGHDEPLYEEDVVEVFLAPDGLHDYFEIEINPLGTSFDARIESPGGVRESMRADPGWTCEGLRSGVRTLRESGGLRSLDVVMRIPFRGLGRGVPKPSETWRGNFFRVDRHPSQGDEYTAWRPTMQSPPDFHVTRAFGSLIFRP